MIDKIKDINLEIIISHCKSKWGDDDDEIRENLIKTRLHLIKNDVQENIYDFTKKLIDVIDLYKDPIEEVDIKKINSNFWLLLRKYDLPISTNEFKEYATNRRQKIKNKTYEDIYEKGYYMPDCTGYVLDLLHKNKNVLLVGPKGCGKTELGKIIYNHLLKTPFVSIDITPKTTRFDLEGLPSIIANQYCSKCGSKNLEKKDKKTTCLDCEAINRITITEEKTWDDGMLTRACRNGQSLLLNELDAAGEDLATGFMQLFQDHNYTVIQTGERIDCKKINIIGTANTLGTGSDTMYNRQIQDKALMSRLIPIHMSYFSDETEINIMKNINPDLDINSAYKIVKLAQNTRKAYVKGEITDVISTRELVMYAEMLGINDRWDESSTLKACLCNRYSPEELPIILKWAENIGFKCKNIQI